MQRFVPVPHDLQPWLEAAVVVDSPAGLAHSRFPAMVSSMLVVRLSGQVRCRGTPVPPSAWISAATAPVEYGHTGLVRAVGLVLRPEAAPSLWSGARGRVNGLCPMADLAGAAWNGVERGILAAVDDDERLAVLCQFIRQAAAPPSPCDGRRRMARAWLDEACAPPQGAGRWMGQRLGLGTRQFERRFAAQWGMSPKQFQVIARLNGALQRAVAEPECLGAHLAADQGYYDQSHMARDVRRLAGQPLQGLVVPATCPAPSAHWPLRVGAEALRYAALWPARRR